MILQAVNEIGAEAVFLYENTNIILLLLRLIYLSDSVQCGEIKNTPQTRINTGLVRCEKGSNFMAQLITPPRHCSSNSTACRSNSFSIRRWVIHHDSPSIAFKWRLYRLGILMSQRYPNSERNSEIVAIPSR